MPRYVRFFGSSIVLTLLKSKSSLLTWRGPLIRMNDLSQPCLTAPAEYIAGKFFICVDETYLMSTN